MENPFKTFVLNFLNVSLIFSPGLEIKVYKNISQEHFSSNSSDTEFGLHDKGQFKRCSVPKARGQDLEADWKKIFEQRRFKT